MKQIAFYVDATKCINCKTSEIACKDVNNAVLGVRIRKVRTFEGGEFPNVFVYNISMSCNHCEDPICVKNCPARAYTKRPEDGIVLQDPEACIGCRNCTWVCPYGAPQYDPGAGRVRKCNMCVGPVLWYPSLADVRSRHEILSVLAGCRCQRKPDVIAG